MSSKVALFLKAILGGILPDALLFGGVASIVWGVHMWNVPAAFITGGVLAVVLSLSAGGAEKK